MNIEQVQEMLAKVQAMADEHDDEMAHVEQDALFRAVLLHIADGGSNKRALAREALKADEIDFARWYA